MELSKAAADARKTESGTKKIIAKIKADHPHWEVTSKRGI